MCTVYIPPITSSHYDRDLISLEEEICSFSSKGKILLIGDFNARTAKTPDYIEEDSPHINLFDGKNVLPDGYKSDNKLEQGLNLLELCLSSRLRILNGRYVGDSLGYFTCMSNNGYSTVDYAIVSDSLLSSVKYFKINNFTYLSDHVQIELYIDCLLNFDKKKVLDEKMETNEILQTFRKF
ncbi:unnamed protein product [Mytilus edulis]|uniref:Endonuclease/exonuclease/phosphatase domain-containing protein n=1 Tax=Mytilus edulis TaxID=6550 RepID=A0A8S3QP80_MYTED|nr:unnamed protein product [Mytilus edulis]